jgi:hypothetical protein
MAFPLGLAWPALLLSRDRNWRRQVAYQNCRIFKRSILSHGPQNGILPFATIPQRSK